MTLLLLTAIVLTAGGPQTAEADDAAYHHHLVLAGALPGDKPLHLHLITASQRVVNGFGRGPTFNRMPYDIDVTKLRYEAGRLHGPLALTVAWDGYTPRNGKAIDAQLDLDVRYDGDSAAGTYRGTMGPQQCHGALQGSRQASPPPRQTARLTLQFEDAIRKSAPMGRQRRVRATLTAELTKAEGTKVCAVRLEPEGSLPDVSDTTEVAEHDLQLVGHRLTGRLVAHVREQEQYGIRHVYDWRIDGLVVGSEAAGRISGTVDGKAAPEGRFWGDACDARIDPRDASWKLTLYDAIATNNFIDLYLATRDGRFVAGFGTTPNFNNAAHTVDVSALQWDAGRLHGTVDVTVRPDPWVPKDHRPVVCRYEVAATVRHGAVTGTFTGQYGKAKVEGACRGNFDPPREHTPLKRLFLSLENGLTGGDEWHNRALIAIELDDGSFTRGRVFNNHTSLRGAVEQAKVIIGSDRRLRVEATIRVAAGGGVTPGVYRFTLDAPIVYRYAAGAYDISGPNDYHRQGTFCAYIN